MIKLIETNYSGNRIEIIVECVGHDHYNRYYFDFDSLWNGWLSDEYTAEEWAELPEVYNDIANQIVDDCGCDHSEALELVEFAMLPYYDQIMLGGKEMQCMTWQSKIKTARMATGLSQLKLANLLQIPRRSIENWECGINEPPIWVQNLLLEKLDTLKTTK